MTVEIKERTTEEKVDYLIMQFGLTKVTLDTIIKMIHALEDRAHKLEKEVFAHGKNTTTKGEGTSGNEEHDAPRQEVSKHRRKDLQIR